MTTTPTFGIGPMPFSEVPEADIRPGFAVLLGGDGAGKSTLLSALSSEGWQCVSYDPEFVRWECSMINDLRDGFIRHALKRIGDLYSSDFVLTLLQACVVYLRDEVGRVAPSG